MKRQKFFIRTFDGLRPVSGYTEDLIANNGETVRIGYDKRSDGWFVTELNTGMKATPFGAFVTRKEAKGYLSPEFLGVVASKASKFFSDGGIENAN